MRTLPTLVVVSLLAASAVSQETTAKVGILGSACETSEGHAMILVNTLPQLGREMSIDYEGPNHLADATQSESHPIFVLGLDRIGAALPAGLFAKQPANCVLLASHDFVLPMMPRANCAECLEYEATVKFEIPSDSDLLGLEFYAQWLVIHRPCEGQVCKPLPDWVAASATLRATIGT